MALYHKGMSPERIPFRVPIDHTVLAPLFRDYVIENGYFPQGGHWEKRKGNLYQFHPAVCEFQSNLISGDSLKTCFRKANIRSIATMGDSHARRYSQGLRSHFERAFPNKSVVFAESVSFDQNSTNKKMAQAMKCSSCTNVDTRNSDKDTDYSLFQQHVISLSIFLPITNRFSTKDIKRLHLGNFKMTYTGYIFKHYFKKTGFPDVLLLCPSFHHTIVQSRTAEAKRQIAKYYHLEK